MNQSIDWLNELSREDAAAEFLKCCGSSRWAEEMAEARPFSNRQAIFDTADALFGFLDDQDWLEAFRAHPKIGEQKAATVQSAQAQKWSAQEQSAVTTASASTID